MTESAEDYADLYENAPCGYLSMRPDGRIIKVNRTFATWSGREAGDLIGQRFQDLLNIAGKIYFDTHFAPLLRIQGFFHEVALDMVRGDGTGFPVLVNAQERRNAAGDVQFIRITIFNATDRRRYERELLAARQAALAASEELRQLNATLEERVSAETARRVQMQEALRQAQKMEAIGQLSGGIAHDFNNLLTVILGGLDTIRRQAGRLPPGREVSKIAKACEMAWRSTRLAADLSGKLLAFSRNQLLDAQPTDVNGLIADFSQIIRATMGERGHVEILPGDGVWPVLVDRTELQNSLLNLAINARDAMPGGGRLTIRTCNTQLGAASLPEPGTGAEPAPPGDYVLIEVADTGTGMDEETRSRVLEPFFTTKTPGKGTGLGLSQVYGFVRQSGGQLRIDSTPGSGTKIGIYLPRHEGSVDAPAPREGWAEPAKAAGTLADILVVEDDGDLRAYVAQVLEEHGYRVAQAAGGDAAREHLEQHSVDLLFTDVVMPGGMDGYQLAQEAVRMRPGLQVLLTTGYTQRSLTDLTAAGAQVALLKKPFTREELADRISGILRRN